MVQLHQIRPTYKKEKRKRIGRGGKRGTYSGKGIKGQKSRGGRRIRPEIRDLIKKIPKKRGYRMQRISEKPAVLNLDRIEKFFNEGEEVSPASLLQKKLISQKSAKMPKIKILGKGILTKKLVFKDVMLSKSAEEKIDKLAFNPSRDKTRSAIATPPMVDKK